MTQNNEFTDCQTNCVYFKNFHSYHVTLWLQTSVRSYHDTGHMAHIFFFLRANWKFFFFSPPFLFNFKIWQDTKLLTFGTFVSKVNYNMSDFVHVVFKSNK